jgi:hypothetical protein
MKNENRKQKKYLLILLFLLFPLKPFAADSLYHIATSNCYGNIVDTALTDSFYLSFNNNTIDFSGRTVFNCGGVHFIKQSFRSDTIMLQRLDTGSLLRCECLYEFEISIPACLLSAYRVILWDENDEFPTIDTLLYSYVGMEWNDVKYNTKQLTINPNPFNLKTNIAISGVQENGVIKLNIIDSNGRIVKIMSANANAGIVSYTWDGTDQNGKAMARGVYVAKAIGMSVNLKKLLVLTR